ncbi:MAG: CHAT domain-containing protein [Williamsia sp.]|nr:CHAT domain-containing protein [Williamsia sp.]
MQKSALYFQVFHALDEHRYTELADVIRTCPVNVNTETALIFLQSNDPYYAMVGMDSMAAAYLFGGNYVHAEVFSKACFNKACDFYDKGVGVSGYKDLDYYIGSSFYYLMKIHMDTGRYDEGIDLYEEISKKYPELMRNHKFIGAHLEASEIFLTKNELEKAQQLLSSLYDAQIPIASEVQYNRLRSKLRQLRVKVTELPEDLLKEKEQTENENRLTIEKTLGHLLEQPSGFSEDMMKLVNDNSTTQWKTASEESNIADTFSQAAGDYEKMFKYLRSVTSGANENHLNELRYRLQQAGKIFFDEANGSSKPHLQEAISEFKRLLEAFEQGNHQSDIDDTLWSLYICYKRLEQYKTAAEMLERLHLRLEAIRSGLTAINERAGVFIKFPHLFKALAEMYYRSGQSHDLFKTIEASKGRNLADKILAQTGKETAQPDTSDNYIQLAGLLAKQNFHYFSLFTDEEWSYAVLVTSGGKIFAEPVQIGRLQLEKWVRKGYQDPRRWQLPRTGLFGKKEDLSSTLTAFLYPVERALQDGQVAWGDHIAYSPDGYMHLFPLHYIKQSNGRYLIEDYTLSRVHGSVQLIQLLGKEYVWPEKILTVTTAAADDYDEKVRDFDTVNNYLQQSNTVVVVQPVVEQVLQSMGRNELAHFTTHGSFPWRDYGDPKQSNPFYSSGLLLCDGNRKPSLDPGFNYYKLPNYLNPQKIEAAKCDLAGTHVSIQACVSGHSKEGAGGDALGLEWAFFSSGASSVIGGNWDLDLYFSNAFFMKFYHYWLVQKHAKSKAYQTAILDIMKNGNNAENYFLVSEWGGLTLSGDFR